MPPAILLGLIFVIELPSPDKKLAVIEYVDTLEADTLEVITLELLIEFVCIFEAVKVPFTVVDARMLGITLDDSVDIIAVPDILHKDAPLPTKDVALTIPFTSSA